MKLILMLPIMLFLHIVDDYYLQGILASMKQKSWWKNYVDNDPQYANDYKMALVEHAFSWSFMINLPWLVYSITTNNDIVETVMISILINTIIHTIVDNEKANRKSINLIIDQFFHFVQIFVTFILYIFVLR